jgi:hypothetical protein
MSPMPFAVRPIDRRAALSRADFEREYLSPSLPVVIPGVYAPADLRRWMDELASSREPVVCVVARRGNVAEISDAERPPVGDAAAHPSRNEFVASLPLAEVIERMHRPDARPPLLERGETLYVFSVPWPHRLGRPAPRPDAGGFAALLSADRRPAQLLVNGPGMLNRAHAHIHSYLLQQLDGSKRVRLFAPEATPSLYHNGGRRSLVEDFDAIDLGRFPAVATIEAWEAELMPGDVLYLPTYWWHEIRVDRAAVSMGTHAPPSPLLHAAADLHGRLAAALEALAAAGAAAPGVARLVLEAAATDLDSASLEEAARHLRYSFDDSE